MNSGVVSKTRDHQKWDMYALGFPMIPHTTLSEPFTKVLLGPPEGDALCIQGASVILGTIEMGCVSFGLSNDTSHNIK